MRIWVDLTNSPHVLVLRPIVEVLRAQGHEVQITARDFAQTLGLLERFGDRAHGRRPPPRRPAGGKGGRAASSRSTALARWARGRRFDLALRPRLQRRHGRGAAAADPLLDDVRLRVGDGPAHRQLPPRADGRRARRDPAGAPGALRRDGQDRRVRGPQGGVLPRRLRARPGGAGRARPRPAKPIAVVRTPPAVSLYHRFENDVFAGVLERLEGARPSCCRARRSSAPSSPAAASSSRSARSTRSR